MEKIIFAQLTKVDESTRQIWGRAVEEAPDASGEIFDYASSKPLIQAWSDEIFKATGGKSRGNLRAMHNPKLAAGKITALNFDDAARAVDIAAEVVDPLEWDKVEKGVYTGFSIGGDYARKWQDGNLMRYTARPTEISLADNPMIKTCRITLIKADGSEEVRDFPGQAPAVPPQRGYGGQADAGYADPGLQEDKKPRYPLKKDGKLDEPRIRAAWNFINKEKNAARYTPDALAGIKDKIIAAWREAIDPAGPPAAAQPARKTAVGELPQGPGVGSTFASLLSAVNYLQKSLDWDAALALGDSLLPGELQEWLARGDELLTALMADEGAEALEELQSSPGPAGPGPLELAAGAGDLANPAARHAPEEMDQIQRIHDHAVSLGATCPGAGAMDQAAKTDLEKATQSLNKLGRESKETQEKLAKVEADKQSLEAEIALLKAEPAAPKGALKAVPVAKTDDAAAPAAEAAAAPQDALGEIKKAHQNPRFIQIT
jgi:hypothetical protein